MNQRIRIARGTTNNIAKHTDIVPPAGQPILDTEKRYLYIGDNETPLSGFKNNIKNLGICAYNLWMPYDNTDKSIAIGNNRTPIYMNESGRPVACNTDLNASIGSVNKPIYFDKNSGMTALDLTQNISDSATKPLFLDNGGNIVQKSNSIGSNTTPVWINNGVITTATSVDAANVNSTIKGKNITDIFEDDGTTAKNSSNVMGKINGKLISNIFEDDGITVKNSTKVNNLEITRDENGVLRIGDVIIPQKKLLWIGELRCEYDQDNVTLSLADKDINAGDTLEIVFHGYQIGKMRLLNAESTTEQFGGTTVDANGNPKSFSLSSTTVTFYKNTKNLVIGPVHYSISTSSGIMFGTLTSIITAIYKVIE